MFQPTCNTRLLRFEVAWKITGQPISKSTPYWLGTLLPTMKQHKQIKKQEINDYYSK